ncbi:hypothetical protein [Rhodohalobacter barkolensis]|nr:hypothetical protein [Rhodohalobacter barkolensis]
MVLKKILFASLFFAGIVTLFAGCQDSISGFEEEPPQLPPTESMDMSFSTFDTEEAQLTSSSDFEAENEHFSHFSNAAIRAFVMKTVVDLNLAIPKVLLTAATQADPEFSEDNEWVWSYSSSHQNQNMEVRLAASEQSDGQVVWDFYVTNSALGLDNYLLFTGITSPENRIGTWTYYRLLGENDGEPVSELSWNITDENQANLQLEVLSNRNGNLGDTINFEKDGHIKSAIYFNAEEDSTVEIEWNSDTNEGYLIAPDYNNGEKACWDSNFENTECG